MAPDDRDRTFERALARHLSSGSGASRPGCLDPEVLAAYHERLLAPEQMVSCKEHISSCGRCQEILAQLEATDELLVDADRQVHSSENVLIMPAPQETSELTAASSGAAGPAAVPSRAARVAQSAWRSKTLHGANWRWLAPAGLLAAGLLIWISFHERIPREFELAKNSTPATPATTPSPSAATPSLPLSPEKTAPLTESVPGKPAASASLGAKPSSSAESPAIRSDESVRRGKILEAESKPLRREEASQSATLQDKAPQAAVAGRFESPRAVSPAPSAAKERDAGQPNLSAATSSFDEPGVAQDKLQSKQDAPVPPTLKLHKDVSANAQAPQTPDSSSTNEAVALSREARKKSKSEFSGGVVQVQNAIAPDAAGATAMRTASSHGYATVTAPNSTTMWRFSSAGLVENSIDAGVTWSIQPTGVVADLLSASAPSAKICWIVGRNATILRTTDAGSHWTQLTAPTPADITSIFAVSAKQATITTSNHETYATKDAGQTWSPVPNP